MYAIKTDINVKSLSIELNPYKSEFQYPLHEKKSLPIEK